MMKAFSFLTILESLSKKLSILRTKMHSNNLRVDYESITSQLRVNPLFSHCASRRASLGTSRCVSHFAAILTILFTIGVGGVSAQETVTWTPTENDLNTLKKDKSNSIHYITVGTGEKSFRIYAVRNEASSSTDVKLTFDNDKYKMDDNSMEKAGLAVFVPATSADVLDIRFYMYTTKSRKTYYASGATCPSSATTTSELATSATAYSFFNTYSKSTYYCAGGKNGGSGESYFTKIEVVFASSGGGDATTPVTGVSLDKTSATLEIGGKETLTATIEPNDATNKNITWSSDAPSVATVDENGVVTAVAAGTATITVTTEDGSKTATCTVTVNAAGGGGGDYPEGYIYITDVKESPEKYNETTVNVAQSSGSCGSDLNQNFKHDGYSNWFETSSGSGYYQLTFTSPIDLSGYTDVKLDLWWGVDNSNNRGVEVYINGTTKIGNATVNSDTRYKLLTLSDLSITASSINTIKINGAGGGGNSVFFRVGIKGTPCGSTEQALSLSESSGTICGTGTTTFTVNGGSGTGELSVTSSDPTKATATINGTTVTVTGVAAGNATITVTKACDATYAEATATYSVTVAAEPTANAGADKTTDPGEGVALAATAAASGCTGVWTIQSGPNTSTAQLSSTSSATATFTPTAVGTYTLRWTVTNTSSSCSAYDEMTVTAAVCSISECGNATLTYPIYTDGNLTTSNLFSGASSTNATAVSIGSSPTFTGVTVSAAAKGSSANAGACYAKGTALTGKMKYSASSKSSSYYIDFPFTVNTGYTFTPCDVQVVIQPVSSNQIFTVEITNGTNVYGTSTATLNAGVMEPIIGLTSPAEMSAGNYAIRLYPHGGSDKEFRMGANVILAGDIETPTTYTVSFETHGGGNVDEITQSSAEAAITLPAAPTKTGYDFTGWYTAETGGTKAGDANASYTPTATITLHAQWTAKITTITLSSQGGSGGTASVTATYGSAMPTITPATLAGYALTGYFDAASGGTKYYNADGTSAKNWDKEAATTTLYAQWNCTAPTITFNNGSYTVGGSALDLSTLFESNSNGAVTYTVTNANGTGATIDGTSFTASAAGTATVKATQAANGDYCSGEATATITVNAAPVTPDPEGSYTITYNYIGQGEPEGWKNGYTPVATYTAGTEQALPTSENITNNNYGEFQGWYDNATFQGNAVTSIPSDATGDIILYAKWVYEIKFFEVVDETTDVENKKFTNPLEGSYPTTYTYGIGITLPELPAKDGYTADGWYSQWCVYNEQKGWVDACKLKELDNKAYGNVNFAVKYTRNVPAGTLYTVTFNANGGSAVSPITQTSEGAAITLPTPTRDGYTFAGWYIGGTLVTTNTYTPTANITADAAWKAECTATGGGSGGETGNVTISPASDAESSYYFSSDQTIITTIVGEGAKAVSYNKGTPKITVDASSKNATITFTIADGYVVTAFNVQGTKNNNTTYALDEDAMTLGIPLTNLEKTKSMVFKLTCTDASGSSNRNTEIESFVISYRTASSGGGSGECYYVTYNGNGATSGYVNDPTAYNSTNNTVTVKENGFTKTGYTFNGWNTAANGSGTSYAAGATFTINSDTELFAQWTENAVTPDPGTQYTVTFNANGHGTAPAEQKVAGGGTITEPTNLTAQDYVFLGWYTDQACTTAFNFSTAINSDITLYAKWNEMDILMEDRCWNISEFETCTITAPQTINQLHIVATPDEAIIIDEGTKKIADINFTNRLKYGGKGSLTTRNLWFSVKGNCQVDIYMMSANSTQTRHLGVATGSFTNVVATFDASPTPAKVTYEYTGGPTTIFLYPTDNGLNIYQICVKYVLPSCTTPVLSDLENKKVCPGSDNITWTASNTASLQDGEKIAYQWTKKGNNTVLSNTATLTLDNVTEAAGGTYVVTATVSANGKASATATKEVTLTVTPATATPTITASASTIFAGNSVKLTASCLSSGVTYQWYTCNDAEGNGESAIGNAKNAEYTPSTATAGTYYYKVIVTGNDTHSCGTAEKVYELVVKTPSAGCSDMIIFDSSKDQTIPAENATGTEENTGASWANVGTSTSSGSCTYTYNGKTYKKGWKFVGGTTKADSRYIQFEIPSGYVGSLFMAGYITSTDRSVFISNSPTGSLVTTYAYIKPSITNELGTASADLDAGTYYVCATDAFLLTELSIEICSDVNCTDPQVTATVDNATVCEGTKNVTFTATNYADGTTTFQWQKKNGNNWDGISGATSATYTISSVTTDHAGKYRVIAQNVCNRISEEVTLTVLTTPTFNTFADEASVMKGNALAISDVQATGATGYAWYKSADNSLDAKEDTKVGTSKDLLLAAASIPEAADQTFYLFCVASNSCGSVTSNAITVTVTPFVEEECATKGNEGEREFGFTNTSCSSITYESKSAWETNSSKEYLTYTAPAGRYFATAKVTVAHTNNSKAVYGYSTNGGTTWTYEETSSAVPDAYTTITIELPADVNAFCIGRNMDGKGTGTGKFYLAEICFTYTTMCTETTLTAGSYNNEYNISTQMDFVEPTFTLKAGETTLEGQTLTYTSSNRAIATVDEDGNVTFEGMTGTVTITATFAGGEINETEYCACQGSYTITVGCKDQAPKIVAAAGTNLNGCNNSITLEAKMQDGTAFADGTFQWYRDGEAIEGATSASYIVVRAGTYTVSRTHTCTTMSSNSAVVTNDNVEPKVERLTPFQYYHVNKDYSNQMKNRHLFAVTSYGTLDGKRYHLTATRNGQTLDLSSSNAFFTIPSSDNAVDTVMIDLNELTNKYAEGDEIVITCAPINNCNTASAITASITIHVIGEKPTLALICSGANGEGTRDTKELVVGGDFLTGYNKADLCQQTGNKTFDANTEWGFYTELKEKYIVTPVNGYAEFNKLNYEPFDILLLTDYPKASKSEAAATILDDMAALCDYRPLLSLKAHMVAKSPSKWAAKGFTTSPVVPATTSQYANIVCYAHPMFDNLDDAQKEGIYHDHDDYNQLVYKILTGPGHESGKGLQGFELKDADNFVTIGLIHYNAAAVVEHDNHTHLEWTPAADDRQLVAIAERQANIEARMILFAINCGAQSMQTPMGRQVLLTCLDYLLKTDLIEVADCRLTFDNGEGAQGSKKWENPETRPNDYEGTGYQGDGKWSTAANWGPEYNVVPGRNNDVRIAAPCTVDADKVEVLSVHITEDGSLTIPADKSFTARSTILRADEHGNVYPTNVEDISLGSNAGGNASLILNNERGDTKAGVAMYSTAKADTDTYSEAKSTWQYIGTPHSDVANAIYNYYDSWLYQYDTGTQGWAVIQNGGPLDPFRGYCITHPEQGHTYWMEGTLAATTNQDITIPAGKFVVVANSWTAPIQIHELTDDDMEGLNEKTIYFFNTGSDPEGDGELNKENGRYAAGTYVSVPIHSAPYTGDSYIPSMQGFYVVGGNADGTLHLDYERHVRAPRTNTPSGPMHAPARRVAADNEPQVAKFLFRGKRYDDRLIILERPDFTRGYDSGWDGEQWGGNAAAPMSYVVTETRWDAVSAIPEYEGTIIGFRAGEDSEYTIHFDYDGMEDALYLLDTDTQIYTRVLKGNSYTFTCADKAEHNRFILTRKAPQIATGTEHINTGENAKAVKFIKDDKIFIFVNGMLYDATGKIVIR